MKKVKPVKKQKKEIIVNRRPEDTKRINCKHIFYPYGNHLSVLRAFYVIYARDWMNSHNITITDEIHEMINHMVSTYINRVDVYSSGSNITYYDYLLENGFSSHDNEVYASIYEFHDNEFRDKEFMKQLCYKYADEETAEKMYNIYLELIELEEKELEERQGGTI